VADEIADVLIYLTELADVLDIDPIAAGARQDRQERAKYPSRKRRPVKSGRYPTGNPEG
jgi:NTP pyrophosphatase (non-canonical NTP hydrolase)